MNWLFVGLVMCAASVAAGAFGAHGLRSALDAEHLALWETSARYLMYGGVVVALLGLAGRGSNVDLRLAGWLLFAGSLIFSGTVAVIAVGGPRWLGAITPIGGTLLIVGVLVFAWRMLERSGTSAGF
ncbi:MAG: DUF423 domain-containing protein [Acidobacteria bacterium]|nr:DUF423 domain-containing protein [Acidobacteriota bacterium]